MKFLENIFNRDTRENNVKNNPVYTNFKTNSEAGTSDVYGFNFYWPPPPHLEYAWLPCRHFFY